MDKITFQNGTTKLNKEMFDTFQNNIENGKQDKMLEGVWTPEISALNESVPDVTYEKRAGTYIKIGKMVFVDFYIRGKVTALNGTNNYGIIKGLPFTSVGTSHYYGQTPLTIGVLYALVEDNNNATFLINPNEKHIRLQKNFGAALAKLIVTTTKYFELGGSGFYMTAD